MSQKQNTVTVHFKSEPDDLSSDLTESVTLVSDEIALLENADIHEINEDIFSPEVLKVRKKRGRKTLADIYSNPIRTFSLKWLKKTWLRDWVAPIPEKPNYVSCIWCKALLRAHLHDLKKHSVSQKHRKNAAVYSKNVGYQNVDINLPSYKNVKPFKTSRSSFMSENASEKIKMECLKPAHIGFIGAGNMAQALISGFLSNGLIETSNLIVSAPSNKNLTKLKPLGIRTTNDNKFVVEESDIVFLAVKPHVIAEVLSQLEPSEGSNPMFVSIAMGLTITRLEVMLSHVVSTPRVIRVMPNTPCMVLQGCCVFSLGSSVTSKEGNIMRCLLGGVGLCEEVPETQLDAVCGLAGSGPAYIYAAIEAMADGGVKMGLSRTLALSLAAQTVKGAAMMVQETGKHPGQLKDEVCSPSGTTITAMHTLERLGFRNALISAVEDSANRSKELS